MLWLQLIVRGFWHPMGHLGDYYLDHGRPERAIALQGHALATARYLAIPAPAEGMAAYNLACALARAGRVADAKEMLADAISLNPDLSANAGRDPDLAAVR
jgi:tetratricopeptide (TPR) repeat protein